MLFLGILLVIVGLLFVHWCSYNYLRSPMFRPQIFRYATFLIISVALQVVLVIGGFFIIFKSSLIVGFVLLGVIILVFLEFKRGSSNKATRNAMYKTYYKVKKRYSKAEIHLDKKEKLEYEKYILLLTLKPRYRYLGKYDTETLKSIVDEYPDIESLTNFVVLFEFFEYKYPRIGIEELRKYVRDAFSSTKELNIGLEEYIKDFDKWTL